MNKDLLLATLIGLGLGLLITTIVVLGPKAFAYLPNLKLPSLNFQLNLPSKKEPPTAVTQPTTTEPITGLTILAPKPDTIVTDKTIAVNGVAEPGSTIVMQGFTNEVVVTTGTDGAYTGNMSLGEGKNDISVTSYKNNKQITQTVTVYYTTEQL